jgi:hypothetical protein
MILSQKFIFLIKKINNFVIKIINLGKPIFNICCKFILKKFFLFKHQLIYLKLNRFKQLIIKFKVYIFLLGKILFN